MKNVMIEAFTELTNDCVLRVPGRRYPGVLIQGDSLNRLRTATLAIRGLAHRHRDTELDAEIQELHDLLASKLKVYEQVLTEHGIEKPY